MKSALAQRARELGFESCRCTAAAPPESAPQFQRWLAAELHGTMDYLERTATKRIDPQLVLEGARSVVTLAASYSNSKFEIQEAIAKPRSSRGDEAQTQEDQSLLTSAATSWEIASQNPTSLATEEGRTRRTSGDTSGVVARYARYADYHDVLAGPLKELTEFINERGGPGTRSLWYVDTGPFLERDLAQRAGLGFIGKHTNLISRELGNWFFLCEIITTLALEPDAPEKNRCGSCVRCLAACPTQAITAPFQLDARRCISYLTIELKGSIPVKWRPAIGQRIYGCDDCLAACPWNRFAREGRLMKQQARADLAAPDLLELLALDDAGFKRRFVGTPMLRTKRRGLLRNVCVALGNTGNPAALSALQRAASDPEPLIAEHARWAMEQIEATNGGR